MSKVQGLFQDACDDIVEAFFSDLSPSDRYAYYHEKGYDRTLVEAACDENEAYSYMDWKLTNKEKEQND